MWFGVVEKYGQECRMSWCAGRILCPTSSVSDSRSIGKNRSEDTSRSSFFALLAASKKDEVDTAVYVDHKLSLGVGCRVVIIILLIG